MQTDTVFAVLILDKEAHGVLLARFIEVLRTDPYFLLLKQVFVLNNLPVNDELRNFLPSEVKWQFVSAGNILF